MSIFWKLKALFRNRESFGSEGIKEDSIFLYSELWQYDLALSIVANLLSNALMNTEWKTYRDGQVIKGDEWVKFNVAMNKKESAAEFYSKLADLLIRRRQVLIVECSRGLFVADDWMFKSGQELSVKPNVFSQVRIGNCLMNRTFEENKNCIFIKLPALGGVDSVFQSMERDFKRLSNLTNKAAEKAMGTKLNLTVNSQRTVKLDETEIARLQRIYEPLMEKPNAVYLTQRGEELSDMTEKQRGSEVQLVIESINNTITINKEILCNVGRAFCVPKQFMLSEYTQENEDVYATLMTWFIKPILKLLSDKFTLFLLNKNSILKGSRIKADLNSIRFVDTLGLANAVDKLISSSAYTVNEIREKIGDDPIENGDERMLTKNYAVVGMKGGNEDENQNGV